MKNLIEILTESKTTSEQMRNYVASWLKQDKGNYEATISVILEAMMDFFQEEMDWYEDKNNIESGKQSKEYNEAAELYDKVKKAYTEWDNI